MRADKIMWDEIPGDKILTDKILTDKNLAAYENDLLAVQVPLSVYGRPVSWRLIVGECRTV